VKHILILSPSELLICRGRKVSALPKKAKTRRIGRDAGTGRFIPVKEAQRRKRTAVVETIKKK